MSKTVVIHIPFKLGYRASGGGVRPQKMIEAFKREGFHVEVISGSNKERNEAFKDLFIRIDSGEIQVRFIYSEAPANPTILTDRKKWWCFRDFFYLILLHKKNIPIALFYRDIHWNVPGIFNFSLLKRIVLRLFHYIDLFFYRFFVDILLLPTEKMAPFIPLAAFFQRAELPPGHDIFETLPDKKITPVLKGIFVGGVLPPVYDISTLFEGNTSIKLTVCCRQDEWNTMKSYYGDVPNEVSIIHKSGKELNDEYLQQHVFVMLRTDHLYLKINQPLKLYEAIGFELPVLVSPGSLVADLVESWGIGWVTSDINYNITSEEYLRKLKKIREIKINHTWDSRVRFLSGLIDDYQKSKTR